jgi:myo-inositol 2-dehydrogenase/D-chiro-inositol 1-dehydrogenase
MSDAIGVGILGAGPVVQAIHLPALARLTDLFDIRSIMDVDEVVASEVANRVGAKAVTTQDALLDDDSIDVVAVCSPHKFHGDQVVAAMEAGKKAVFCEKPLAMSREEAERIAEVSKTTGVPLIVGAMHTFDPAWIDVTPHIEQLRREAHIVRSSIVLPFNDRFEDWATEVISRPPFALPDTRSAAVRAEMMPFAILGLAIHDLPLVRSFMPPGRVHVSAAEFVDPFGYAITARVGDVIADVSGLMQPHWRPQWQFEVISHTASLHIDFTPSFVHAGSATVRFTDASGTRVFGGHSHNGYEGEWRAIAAAVNGDASLVPAVEDLIEDITFALALADQSAALQEED